MNKKIIAAVTSVVVALSVGAATAASAHDRGGKSDRSEHRTEKQAVITSTLGITAEALKTRLQAGETLATIAGTKKDALITALVAFETKKVDARVTAGKLTAAQATTLKSNLTAKVTAMVNSVKGFGKKGHGSGYKDGKGKSPYRSGASLQG